MFSDACLRCILQYQDSNYEGVDIRKSTQDMKVTRREFILGVEKVNEKNRILFYKIIPRINSQFVQGCVCERINFNFLF